MKFGLIWTVLLLNSGMSVLNDGNWKFLAQLQELCPYSSFCENNATMSLPKGDKILPCCDSCSCKPGCELANNCCHDSASSNKTNILRTCSSPIVSNVRIKTTNYSMIYSCPNSWLKTGYSNSTLCVFENNDYKSFAPVVSEETGNIYVNLECALCNDVKDTLSWKLSVKCPHNTEDHTYDTQRLLQDSGIDSTGCYLAYVPPKHINIETQVCRNDVIRACNVSGNAYTWEPLWEYCPMFNAAFSRFSKKAYGNVFCYMCNKDYTDRIAKACGDGGNKHPFGIPFNVVLDLDIAERDILEISDQSDGVCRATEVMVNAFETECRRVECPSGQFRIGDKCGFYSKEWIGGPFTAVLKLIPLDTTQKINKTMLSDLTPELKFDKKARWLKRNAMKHWNIETLYKPSTDQRHIDYLVALSMYPYRNVNPARLQTILKQTLKETWQIQINNQTIPIRVQLSRCHRYHKVHKDNLANISDIDGDFVYTDLNFQNTDADILYAVYTTIDQWSQNMFLGELFLCDQIQLRTNEYEKLRGIRPILWFKVTNKLLSVTQYRITNDGSVLICLNRFPQNTGKETVHQLGIAVLVACSLVWFTCIKLCGYN